MPIGFRCNNCITIHSYIPKQSQKNIKGSFLLCSYHQSPDASSACFVVHVRYMYYKTDTLLAIIYHSRHCWRNTMNCYEGHPFQSSLICNQRISWYEIETKFGVFSEALTFVDSLKTCSVQFLIKSSINPNNMSVICQFRFWGFVVRCF